MVTTLGNFDLILGILWLEQHDLIILFKNRSLTFKSDYCITHCLLRHKPTIVHSKGNSARSSNPDHDIAEISAYAFTKISENPINQIIAMWPKHFEQLIQLKKKDKQMLINVFTIDITVISVDDYEKFFNKLKKLPLSRERLKELIPQQYYEYIDRWDSVEANKLPPRRLIDY